MDEKIRDKKNKREKKDTKKALREHLHLTISRSSQRVKKRHGKDSVTLAKPVSKRSNPFYYFLLLYVVKAVVLNPGKFCPPQKILYNSENIFCLS